MIPEVHPSEGQLPPEAKETANRREAVLREATHELGHYYCAYALGWKARKTELQIKIKGKIVGANIDMDVTYSDPDKPNLVFYAAGYAAERMFWQYKTHHSREDNQRLPMDRIEEAIQIARELIEPYKQEIASRASRIADELREKKRGNFKYTPRQLDLPELR